MIIQILNTRLFDRQNASSAVSHRIQHALQSTAHPSAEADKLRGAAGALDPDDQRDGATGYLLN